ncbi:MAG: L-2-hydroxyglutarate dehydrogenase [Chlamydiales bacterium]|nr:L-2-hydroxyglutarate dehydrogenase [Chlamydiales bacterium]MCH9635112.1 L-2-hydroxyglutarate dehydrogenase [Chlamydiales bacterium]MCH9703828.1 L-2-hydroxyglutarate oxidase [Chlamydiota bacterium]
MKTDFLIIGSGIIGLTLALEIKKRDRSASVTIIEKEHSLALHGSGRNSGVLHAGFYYTADSMKARFTKEGNRLLTAYCEKKGLHINRCGKLVVANSEQEQEGLDELFKRGRKNGVAIEEISEKEAKKIEPYVRTQDRALFSPSTKSIDPVEVVHSLAKDAQHAGIEILFDAPFLKREADGILTGKGKIEAGYVVNAAGLYADRVAHPFNVGRNYRILPFKGLYLYSKQEIPLRTNIYPVPNLKNPFLGVHFTVTAAGKAKIGPTAIPCLWREQYGGLENFSWSELLDIAKRQAKLLMSSNFDFKQLAAEEIKKQKKSYLSKLANQMVCGLSTESFTVWGKPGIRAQLFDTKKNALEMDFVVERGERSIHILNAVSPALTCSFAFAKHVVDLIIHEG